MADRHNLWLLRVSGFRSRGSAEKCLALQLCFLVPTLGCHVIDLVIFLDKRDAPSQVGWTPSPLTRPGFLQKVCQLSTKPTPFTGHHLDSQRLKDNMRLNMASPDVLGRGPEKTTVSDIDFAKAHTDSTLTLVTSDIRSRESLLPTWITILLYLGLVLASSFSLESMSPALAPAMQLTVVAGVANLTFLRTESPITRVCFSMGASLSGENLLETWVGGSLIVGFLRVALCPLRTVTQPPWAPGCTGQVGGLLAEAKLRGSAATSGGWLTTAYRGSKLRSRASKSLSFLRSNKEMDHMTCICQTGVKGKCSPCLLKLITTT